MKKIGVSTVQASYNYGSVLQAYASKVFLKTLGYDSEVIALKGSLIKGRDIRLKKLAVIAGRIMLHPKKMIKRAQAYQNGRAAEYSEESRYLFAEFRQTKVRPVSYSWHSLKKTARSKEYFAFLCGSDQIWNADILYVDPQYYLRYAPKEKRIAFAPSFGRDSVADYNKKIIKKYVNDIPVLSVRETSGQRIIKELTGRDSVHLIDPTLMVAKEQWVQKLNLNDRMGIEEDYILAYFLNEPSEQAQQFIRTLKKNHNMKVLALPYDRKQSGWFTESVNAGPLEFLKLVNNAACVCTDSFHGTAFSINLHTPYYTFERQYEKSEKQSSRILSLLNLVDQLDRFNPEKEREIDFTYSENILCNERRKAEQFLKKAFADIENR